MCGIAGFCDFNMASKKSDLVAMTDVLHHRGPNDSGYEMFKCTGAQIGLGHRRLSILDLTSHGHQPMIYENLVMVYNGEIYNFESIKIELQGFGYQFQSDSDSEVVLKAFHKWGVKSVDKFNGMFAFVILDNINNKLFFLRDRTGVKPLYYYKLDDLFLFSSELKSFHHHPGFLKKIDPNSLRLYLKFGYIPEPYCIFKNTYKLKSGTYLEIDLKNGVAVENTYWSVIDYYNKPKLNISEDEAVDELEILFKSSFDYRMIADVKVGVFLSGGYDSSLLAAILQSNRTEKLNTFTIGFKEKGYDEAPDAKTIASYLGTNHTEYYCTQKDALEILPRLCEIYDEPFGDSSAIPTCLISELARKKVGVTLSADGGDEIFAGYDKYFIAMNYHNFFELIPAKVRTALSSGLKKINPRYLPFINKKYNFSTRYEKIINILDSGSIVQSMSSVSKYFTDKECSMFLKDYGVDRVTNFDLSFKNGETDLDKMLAIDYKTYLVDDILVKIDRASMSCGLEGREPLLDYRIIEFVAQLPDSFKYNGNNRKSLLKQVAHRYLPKDMMDRPKKGFSVPLTDWFKDELREYFMVYLDPDRIEKEGFFEAEEVVKLRDSYLMGNKENVQKLWFLLMFGMWYERWM